MKYVCLKDTDLKLSRICLGSAGFGEKLDRDQSFSILDAFVRAGGNFIDTANVYCKWVETLGNCSEQVLGEWMKSRGAAKNVVIATKGGHYLFGGREGISRVNRQEIRKDLEESARTLGLETIDFYWLHRDDPQKPAEEIVDILEELRKEGKIRYYGFSNYRMDRLRSLDEVIRRRTGKGITAVSNQWSLASINSGGNMNPDPTLVEFSREEYQWHCETGSAAIPFSSTAMGFFSKLQKAGIDPGKEISSQEMQRIPEALRKAYWNEENLERYQRLLELQKETGKSLQALSLAYFFTQPFQAIPVTGVNNCCQLQEAVDACEIQLEPGIFAVQPS